nr:hypothetical protein [uncultured Draconibacterium sp.]
MRKYFLIIVLSIFVGNVFGQAINDSIAIIQLLEKESRTWRNGDTKGHAECWQIRPYNRIWVTPENRKLIDVPPSMIMNPAPGISGKGGLAVLSDIKMNIYNGTAWVSHDEVSIATDGKESYSHEMRFLEKVEMEWKLIGQSMYSYTPEKTGSDTTSYINVVDIASGQIETVLAVNKHLEAPNWHRDNYLILNSYGRLTTLDLETKELKLLNTGHAIDLNNDHGLSPDHKSIAISNFDQRGASFDSFVSSIYVLPVEGGEPRKVSSEKICFWHGWSPDGKTLAYTGLMDGDFDIYTIDINGGPATQLTNTKGLDDGPDYSYDGKYIYFNSYRTGHMQIWRMLADGSNPEQLTFDEHSNWFAHPSPDNKWIVYIAYIHDQEQNHLFGKEVKLRLMNLETKEITDLTPVFYGGQGTINVPSWSPDSKKIAFVSYSIK